MMQYVCTRVPLERRPAIRDDHKDVVGMLSSCIIGRPAFLSRLWLTFDLPAQSQSRKVPVLRLRGFTETSVAKTFLEKLELDDRPGYLRRWRPCICFHISFVPSGAFSPFAASPSAPCDTLANPATDTGRDVTLAARPD